MVFGAGGGEVGALEMAARSDRGAGRAGGGRGPG